MVTGRRSPPLFLKLPPALGLCQILYAQPCACAPSFPLHFNHGPSCMPVGNGAGRLNPDRHCPADSHDAAGAWPGKCTVTAGEPAPSKCALLCDLPHIQAAGAIAIFFTMEGIHRWRLLWPILSVRGLSNARTPRCCWAFYGVGLRFAPSARCPMTSPIGSGPGDTRADLARLLGAYLRPVGLHLGAHRNCRSG